MLVFGLRDILGNFVGSNMGSGETSLFPRFIFDAELSRLILDPDLLYAALTGVFPDDCEPGAVNQARRT